MPEHFELELGERTKIRERLKELGLTQVRMAESLNVSQKHITLVLNGYAPPSYSLLERMLDYVGLELTAVRVDDDRDAHGHWFFATRCERCGVSYYDEGADKPCPGGTK